MFKITCSKCGETVTVGVSEAVESTFSQATPGEKAKAGDLVPKEYWEIPKPQRFRHSVYGGLFTEKRGDDWFFITPPPR